MLARIEEEQFFQFSSTFFGDTGGEKDVHARFLDSTRFHRSAAD
jgi:hypothetical protein